MITECLKSGKQCLTPCLFHIVINSSRGTQFVVELDVEMRIPSSPLVFSPKLQDWSITLGRLTLESHHCNVFFLPKEFLSPQNSIGQIASHSNAPPSDSRLTYKIQVQVLAGLVQGVPFLVRRVGKNQELCVGRNSISGSDKVDSKTLAQC
jgi:hypothetical protein